jgi:hypothetical protein
MTMTLNAFSSYLMGEQTYGISLNKRWPIGSYHQIYL